MTNNESNIKINKKEIYINKWSYTWFALASHLLFLLFEKITLEGDPLPHILVNSSRIS